MEPLILVGTEGGLWRVRSDGAEPVESVHGRTITALARDAARTWALVGGQALWIADADGRWHERASIAGPPATCLAVTPSGLLIGTEQAHLLRLADTGLVAEPVNESGGREAPRLCRVRPRTPRVRPRAPPGALRARGAWGASIVPP